MSAGGNPVSNLRLTRRRLIAATLGSGLLGMRATAADSIRRLDPVSEAAKDPALLKYVERLKAIVAKRDTPALLALMNPTFRVDFDGGKGPLAFAKHWKPDTPDSAVWKILDRLLSLGGTFYTPTLFAIPYVYTKFPFDLDPFAYVVVTRDQAALRPEADPEATPIVRLQTGIVAIKPGLKAPVRELPDWIKVEVPNGPQGFVAAEDVYSPAGYRVFFERRGGKWVWFSLVCAD